jgi:hypothetical protein
LAFLLRRSAPEPVAEAPLLPLAQQAVNLLEQAARVQLENPDEVVEERAVWQPDSWLLQCCWQALADQNAGGAAMAVSIMLASRNPLAPLQALHRTAQRVAQRPELAMVVADQLNGMRDALFAEVAASEQNRHADRLLLAAASAALIGDLPLACSCLERLDQFPRIWDRVLISSELRTYLAEAVVHIGLHPLTSHLILVALRRYEDAGAQFIYQILSLIGPRVAEQSLPRRTARLLRRCVETFQYASLASLNARRLATVAFGHAGWVQPVLEQVSTINNVQEARREAGLSSSKGDPHFIRQVKRPTADLDVDFQVYTLQEAIKVMPVRAIGRDQRIALADRVAALAIRSDGWTAAGAASTLVGLGALKYAVDVVDHIALTDPTRSEGVISLVRSLLSFGEVELAKAQVDKALGWLRAHNRRSTERATIWGLAEVYLEHNNHEMALRLLDFRLGKDGNGAGGRPWARFRRLFNDALDDDQLRDNKLRFQALLRQMGGWRDELLPTYEQLCQGAPRLLDGETLISFYVDGLLHPLLEARAYEQVWRLLPQIGIALSSSSGDKHAVHVQRATRPLAELAIAVARQAVEPVSAEDAGTAPEPAGAALELDEVGAGTVQQAIAQARGPDLETAGVEGEHVEAAGEPEDGGASDGAPAAPAGTQPEPPVDVEQVYSVLRQFLRELWQADAQKGLWQVIHGIEGSLSLFLALEGSRELLTVARHVSEHGEAWSE